ncbi:MAG TPA: beta-ketoacyl synthase N-terminal-like domain-containing protein [Thermoanaerobaculia bacterium]|nr:beta-ketoacyl synthase N-terminal-like domain-containing protein [Thermoanaerobaculia bacterium]
MSEPVLITGLGTLGAWGGGSERLAAALAAGAPLAREVDRSAGYHLPHGARRACLVPPGELAGWLSPGEARRMSPPSKLAVTAARMALRCAGIASEGADEAGTAVVIATAFGPSSNTETLLKQILDEGPEAASPSLFMESVANAPAAQIAIALKARGASVTVCEREAGPLIALGTGAAEIAAGRAGRVLAGSVDEMTPLLHALLDRFGALAREGGDGEELARPFDRRRNGFLAGEGGTVVVLESAASLAARGGRALARVLARGSAFDPTAPPSGWGHGHKALARSLRRTLERAGLTPQDVDLVVSGASGAREGDRLEVEVLRAVWEGGPLPPVAAPKAVMGEYGGGHLGAAVLAAAGSSLGPTLGFAEADPALGITPLDGSPREAPSVVLATSLAAGGAAAWVVLGRG